MGWCSLPGWTRDVFELSKISGESFNHVVPFGVAQRRVIILLLQLKLQRSDTPGTCDFEFGVRKFLNDLSLKRSRLLCKSGKDDSEEQH